MRLRSYLASGGVLFVNDFWSDEWRDSRARWSGCFRRALVDLRPTHPVFHCIYDLRGPMHRWRVPTMQLRREGPPTRTTPCSATSGGSRRSIRGDARLAPGHEAGRIQVAVHNSDLRTAGSGKGESDFYFDRFSERIAYPLGINIVIYLYDARKRSGGLRSELAVPDDRTDGFAGEFIPAIDNSSRLHEAHHAHEVTPQVLDEFDRRGGCSAVAENVVHQQHPLSGVMASTCMASVLVPYSRL